jgi:Leucine-rich repeat (LRR) protein
MSIIVGEKAFKVKKNDVNLSKKGITDIAEIKGLESLTNLHTLNLGNNKITEIRGLENIPSLRKLNLWGNKITEIKGLDALTNLQELDLGGNDITEIKNLGSLRNLQVLVLAANHITEIKGLENLTQLSFVDLSFNPVLKRVKKEIRSKLGSVKSPLTAVAYCRKRLGLSGIEEGATASQNEEEAKRQASIEAARLEQLRLLKFLVQVSKNMKISQMAQILDIPEKELRGRITDLSTNSGFSLDGDVVKIGEGRQGDFIAVLDIAFADWGKKTFTKNGKQ